MIRTYVLATALLVTPLAAGAQFTAVVTPPRKEAPVEVVTPEVRQRADSVHRATLTDMKQWVDSAATALTGRSVTTTDSVARTPVAPITAAQVPERRNAVTTRESAPLPDTATPLPALVLAGLGMIAAGLFLLRKRHA